MSLAELSVRRFRVAWQGNVRECCVTYPFCEGFLGFRTLIDSCHEHFAFELYDGFLIVVRGLLLSNTGLIFFIYLSYLLLGPRSSWFIQRSQQSTPRRIIDQWHQDVLVVLFSFIPPISLPPHLTTSS